jgi:hypothetical protein
MDFSLFSLYFWSLCFIFTGQYGRSLRKPEHVLIVKLRARRQQRIGVLRIGVSAV